MASILIALCLLSGCASKPGSNAQNAVFSEKRPLFPGERRLQPGDDVCMFVVVGENETRLEATVDQEGWLDVPGVGKLHVLGKSETETEVVLAKACRAKGMVFLGAPPKSTLFYLVTGEVQHPGKQVYLSRLTLRQAIESAGGLTAPAKASKVRIWRGDGSTEQYDCRRIVDSPEAGPEVLPGDVVEVKREVCAQNPPAETTGAKQEWTPCARPANGANRGERTLRSTVAQKSEWQSFPKSGNVPV